MSAQLCGIHCGGSSIGVFLFGSPNFMKFIWGFYYDLLTSKSLNIDHLYLPLANGVVMKLIHQ